jgi:hypothetical protein
MEATTNCDNNNTNETPAVPKKCRSKRPVETLPVEHPEEYLLPPVECQCLHCSSKQPMQNPVLVSLVYYEPKTRRSAKSKEEELEARKLKQVEKEMRKAKRVADRLEKAKKIAEGVIAPSKKRSRKEMEKSSENVAVCDASTQTPAPTPDAATAAPAATPASKKLKFPEDYVRKQRVSWVGKCGKCGKNVSSFAQTKVNAAKKQEASANPSNDAPMAQNP